MSEYTLTNRFCKIIITVVEFIMRCDPILEMVISQDDLRVMYERLERSKAKVKPCFSGNPSSDFGGGDPVYSLAEVSTPFMLRSDDVKRPNKYRNIKVEYDGMKFDSKHELKCWINLKLLEDIGDIKNLKRQVRFELEVNGKRTGKITVDFTWMENGHLVVADAKSEITRKERSYRMQKRHFEAQYAPLVIREL